MTYNDLLIDFVWTLVFQVLACKAVYYKWGTKISFEKYVPLWD